MMSPERVVSLVIVYALLLVGCNDQISRCGWACHGAGSKMVSYSPASGCLCDTPVRCTDVDGGR